MQAEAKSPYRKKQSRRGFLKMTGLGLSAAGITAAPFEASATPKAVLQAAEKIVGDRAAKDGRIAITMPEIAEDGGTVPISVAVDSPMTADDHVTALHIFADGNPLPEVASYYFGPHNGKANMALRIRLGRTQKVVAFAEMSTGDIYTASKQIKVTLGGCGG